MRGDLDRIRDILEAIDRIERYGQQGREAFDRDELVQTWMIHHIQIIGEAARGLSEDVRAQYPSIPWSQMIGMRHILVHDYFGIDLEEVWGTAVHDLPVLKQQLEALLVALEPPSRESSPSESAP